MGIELLMLSGPPSEVKRKPGSDSPPPRGLAPNNSGCEPSPCWQRRGFQGPLRAESGQVVNEKLTTHLADWFWSAVPWHRLHRAVAGHGAALGTTPHRQKGDTTRGQGQAGASSRTRKRQRAAALQGGTLRAQAREAKLKQRGSNLSRPCRELPRRRAAATPKAARLEGEPCATGSQYWRTATTVSPSKVTKRT
jgi:hypothetical protein